jgi:hypothetical protein
MNGELASVSCDLESAVCSTETVARATTATLRQRFSKAWVVTWNGLARIWATLMEDTDSASRLCETMPIACHYRG